MAEPEARVLVAGRAATYQRAIENAGYRTVRADDDDEILERAPHADVAVVDARSEPRTLCRRVPTIVVGEGGVAEAVAAMKAGAAYYLTRPFDASALLAQIRSAIRNTPNGCLAGRTLKEIEQQAILDTLRACGGNKAATARALGVCEKTIYNKMRRFGIR